MKRPQLLLLLILLAAGAGFYLHWHRPVPDPAPGLPPAQGGAPLETIRSFLAGEGSFDLPELPPTTAVSADELARRIADDLEQRHGREELALRSRAFALLHLLPPGQDLREQWLQAHLAGARGWFDEHSGTIYLREDFQPSFVSEQALLVRLSARWLFHREQPSDRGDLPEDAALAHWALHGGLAATMEARFRALQRGDLPLPTTGEIEREAVLLSLPLYTHNLVQLPVMQGKDFVEARLAEGASYHELLAAPPRHTLALLDHTARALPPPQLPALEHPLLEDTLGAYSAQLLAERLSDYVVAESLGPDWRSDRYVLFQEDGDQHLLWVSRWATPGAAERMAALLQGQTSPDSPRLLHTAVRQDLLIYANCATQSVLDGLLSATLSSPTSPPPSEP